MHTPTERYRARLMDRLPIHLVVTIPTVVKLLKTTKPTAGKAVQLLESLGVLTEALANSAIALSHTLVILRS
jgi:hypothetical protein